MDYAVFESRVMEVLFKTNARLTPQLAAFRVGCPVEVARQYLEQMATRDILIMEPDENGTIFYDVVGRPAPTNEPLSWTTAGNAATQFSTFAPPGPVHQHGTVPVNIQIHNAPVQAPPQQVVVVSGSEKSAATAAILALFFGPLGMLYSTGVGALVMFFATLVLVPVTAGVGLLVTIPACMIWAANAASEHNRKLRAVIPTYAFPPPPPPPAQLYPPR